MNRVAVVTGALSGLGKSTCAALEADGDRVIRVDISNSDVNADLATVEGRQEALQKIAELAGDTVDAVVTWAGGGGATLDLLRVNYFGTVDLVEGLHTRLSRSAAPRVLVTSSRMSLEPADEPLVELLLAHDERQLLASYGDETVSMMYYIGAKTIGALDAAQFRGASVGPARHPHQCASPRSHRDGTYPHRDGERRYSGLDDRNSPAG